MARDGAGGQRATQKQPLSPAKRPIAMAAERLFAARGIDGVSLREIAEAAGSRNNNAVQYHFATREGLMAAIYAARVAEMEERRASMLERAEAEGVSGDSFVLLQILCLPHLALRAEDGSHPYAGFLVHYALRYWQAPAPVAAIGQGGVGAVQKRVVELIAESIGDVPPQIVRLRIMLSLMLFLNAVLRWDHVERFHAEADAAAMLGDALRSAHAALNQMADRQDTILFADMLVP